MTVLRTIVGMRLKTEGFPRPSKVTTKQRPGPFPVGHIYEKDPLKFFSLLGELYDESWIT